MSRVKPQIVVPAWEDVENEVKAQLIGTLQALSEQGLDERESDFKRGIVEACRRILNFPETLANGKRNVEFTEIRDAIL